jgi:hypothetical protein
MLLLRYMVLLGAFFFLGGCVNPYSEFYQGDTDAKTRVGYIARTGPVQIYSSDDFERDGRDLARRGYVLAGSSAFNGAAGSVTQQQLLSQADKVGAHLVLISSRSTGSIVGAVPITMPTTTTSQTTGSATVYGSGGSATAHGRATTTTYGQQTMMMPYTIERADFTALFFVKNRPLLGVMWESIDETTIRRLQTNQALRVSSVVEGSPAFLADVLPNDIIMRVDGLRVMNAQSLVNYLSSKAGEEISLLIDRDGTQIEKRIRLESR